MARHVPELATQLGDELGKPEPERDLEKISNLVGQAALTTGFTAGAGLHAVKPKAAPKIQEPTEQTQLPSSESKEPGPPLDIVKPPNVKLPEAPVAPVAEPMMAELYDGLKAKEKAGTLTEKDAQELQIMEARQQANTSIAPETGGVPRSLSVTEKQDAMAALRARIAANKEKGGGNSPNKLEGKSEEARFVLQNGVVFDKLYKTSVTPPAMESKVHAEILEKLNASDFNGKFVNPVSVAFDPATRESQTGR
jgi:hypothetical protein